MYVLLNKREDFKIGTTINLHEYLQRHSLNCIVSDIHGEYIGKEDCLTFSELTNKFSNYPIVKIVGTETVSRKNVSNTEREVYKAEICTKETRKQYRKIKLLQAKNWIRNNKFFSLVVVVMLVDMIAIISNLCIHDFVTASTLSICLMLLAIVLSTTTSIRYKE